MERNMRVGLVVLMDVKFVFLDLVRIGFRMGLVSEREARLDLLRVGSPRRGGLVRGQRKGGVGAGGAGDGLRHHEQLKRRRKKGAQISLVQRA
jgi:hypothetical protein